METLYTLVFSVLMLLVTIKGLFGIRLIYKFLKASKRYSKRSLFFTFKQIFKRMGVYQIICTFLVFIFIVVFILWIICLPLENNLNTYFL